MMKRAKRQSWLWMVLEIAARGEMIDRRLWVDLGYQGA